VRHTFEETHAPDVFAIIRALEKGEAARSVPGPDEPKR